MRIDVFLLMLLWMPNVYAMHEQEVLETDYKASLRHQLNPFDPANADILTQECAALVERPCTPIEIQIPQNASSEQKCNSAMSPFALSCTALDSELEIGEDLAKPFQEQYFPIPTEKLKNEFKKSQSNSNKIVAQQSLLNKTENKGRVCQCVLQ